MVYRKALRAENPDWFNNPVPSFGDETARSQAPVVAWEGDNRVEANELILNLNTEVAVLRGSVRSIYVPEE